MFAVAVSPLVRPRWQHFFYDMNDPSACGVWAIRSPGIFAPLTSGVEWPVLPAAVSENAA